MTLSRDGMKYDPAKGVPGLLVLLDIAGKGSSGTVWRGYLDLGVDGSVAVVVKMGEWEVLRHEVLIYQHLNQRGITGVPFCLGLYQAAQSIGLCTIGLLMLSDEGRTLCPSKGIRANERCV